MITARQVPPAEPHPSPVQVLNQPAQCLPPAGRGSPSIPHVVILSTRPWIQSPATLGVVPIRSTFMFSMHEERQRSGRLRPVSQPVWRLRQEDHKFKASLDILVHRHFLSPVTSCDTGTQAAHWCESHQRREQSRRPTRLLVDIA